MTHKASGKVIELTTRNFTSKAGKTLTKHGVVLDSGQAFELDGFKQTYRVGDLVADKGVAIKYKFWTETGSYSPGAPDMPGMKPGATSAPTPSPAYGAGATSSSREVGFPIPRDSYQQAIIRQNSLTNAVSLVNSALGEVSLADEPPAQIKEVQDRADLAIRIAYKLAAFSSGHLDTMASEAMAREVQGLLANGAKKAVE